MLATLLREFEEEAHHYCDQAGIGQRGEETYGARSAFVHAYVGGALLYETWYTLYHALGGGRVLPSAFFEHQAMHQVGRAGEQLLANQDNSGWDMQVANLTLGREIGLEVIRTAPENTTEARKRVAKLVHEACTSGKLQTQTESLTASPQILLNELEVLVRNLQEVIGHWHDQLSTREQSLPSESLARLQELFQRVQNYTLEQLIRAKVLYKQISLSQAALMRKSSVPIDEVSRLVHETVARASNEEKKHYTPTEVPIIWQKPKARASTQKLAMGLKRDEEAIMNFHEVFQGQKPTLH